MLIYISHLKRPLKIYLQTRWAYRNKHWIYTQASSFIYEYLRLFWYFRELYANILCYRFKYLLSNFLCKSYVQTQGIRADIVACNIINSASCHWMWALTPPGGNVTFFHWNFRTKHQHDSRQSCFWNNVTLFHELELLFGF